MLHSSGSVSAFCQAFCQAYCTANPDLMTGQLWCHAVTQIPPASAIDQPPKETTMSRHTMTQMMTNLRQTITQRSLMFALSPVLVGMAYHSTPALTVFAAHADNRQPCATTTLYFDPNQQAVLDYLRAHGANVPARSPAATDPSAQAVLDYLCAHHS